MRQCILSLFLVMTTLSAAQAEVTISKKGKTIVSGSKGSIVDSAKRTTVVNEYGILHRNGKKTVAINPNDIAIDDGDDEDDESAPVREVVREVYREVPVCREEPVCREPGTYAGITYVPRRAPATYRVAALPRCCPDDGLDHIEIRAWDPRGAYFETKCGQHWTLIEGPPVGYREWVWDLAGIGTVRRGVEYFTIRGPCGGRVFMRVSP